MPNKTRVSCFIDGFNLYHAIDDMNQEHLKWLDLSGLMHEFVKPDIHEIVDIFYYTAIAAHRPNSALKHREYIIALEHSGVNVVLGNFKKIPQRCHSCDDTWIRHEEKKTDVNLALGIVEHAFKDAYDSAYVVTGDSDLVPAIKLVKEMRKDRKIKIIGTPGRTQSKELIEVADKKAKIGLIHLENNLFPEYVTNEAGYKIYRRPSDWDPPN